VRFADLRNISQPTLVVNGVIDSIIPIRNSYWLAENLPNAVLLVYPDAGHGSLFQYPEAFARQANAFLARMWRRPSTDVGRTKEHVESFR